jgi:hypothetical protein
MKPSISFRFHGVGTSISRERKNALLTAISEDIASASGIQWRVTSIIRDSPGHRDGDAADIAPAMLKGRADGTYKTAHRSDPVLHLRPALLNCLTSLAMGRRPWLGQLAAILALENDHIHIQLVRPGDPKDAGTYQFIPFGKDLRSRYPDSLRRQAAARNPLGHRSK